VLKIVENLWAVEAPTETPLESSQCSPRPPSWWGGVAVPSPRTPTPLSALHPSTRHRGHTPVKWPGIVLSHVLWGHHSRRSAPVVPCRCC